MDVPNLYSHSRHVLTSLATPQRLFSRMRVAETVFGLVVADRIIRNGCPIEENRKTPERRLRRVPYRERPRAANGTAMPESAEMFATSWNSGTEPLLLQ